MFHASGWRECKYGLLKKRLLVDGDMLWSSGYGAPRRLGGRSLVWTPAGTNPILKLLFLATSIEAVEPLPQVVCMFYSEIVVSHTKGFWHGLGPCTEQAMVTFSEHLVALPLSSSSWKKCHQLSFDQFCLAFWVNDCFAFLLGNFWSALFPDLYLIKLQLVSVCMCDILCVCPPVCPFSYMCVCEVGNTFSHRFLYYSILTPQPAWPHW